MPTSHYSGSEAGEGEAGDHHDPSSRYPATQEVRSKQLMTALMGEKPLPLVLHVCFRLSPATAPVGEGHAESPRQT